MTKIPKPLSINNARRTRFKVSMFAMGISTLTLGFFTWLAHEQYQTTGDISVGIAGIISAILTLITAVVQIYGKFETQRSSQNTIVQVGEGNTNKQILPPSFEDEGDDEPLP